MPDPAIDVPSPGPGARQVAVLAGGCFWCVEAVYRQLDGVLDVVSGYAGGTAETADYKTVCTGTTDHAEAVQITFDPNVITYGRLLKVFFGVAHDPTQLDRQGADVGRQYRSAIFYSHEQQRKVAESYIRQLEAAGAFSAPIVTRLEPLTAFYSAEDYHQDYAALNPTQPYVACTALPKVAKVRKYFPRRESRLPG
ncbi:MAG: peptide-methionine (S)-S-oxide reductase MsrA [Phycisphaerae bacterium]